jgi:para-aminobenzoate synthetase component 1
VDRLVASGAPHALVGGRLASGLMEVATDPSALDTSGFWVVVGTFEGRWTCARFAHVEPVVPARAPSPRPWSGPPTTAWTTSLSEREYMAGVQRVRDLIAAGTVYQVNLCRVLSAPLADAASLDALAALLADGNPAPYAARVLVPDAGVDVVCASPELFLRRDGRSVASAPIKGTGRVVDDLAPKDVAENVMIVDLVRNDLGRVCRTGSVAVDDALSVEQHPGLVHLVSTVRGELVPEATWPDVLAALFPPGSVSGAPKSTALTTISSLEPTERGPYCGAIGWVDADDEKAELAVGIRTFWRRDGLLHFGTGAGITWGSDPEREWHETELKAAHLLLLASDGRSP